MGAEHPTAWCQVYDGGRSWYTGGGHTDESFADPDFLQHLLGGLDRGDVNLLHWHHRLERSLGLVPSCCHGIRQHARRDLPREAPAVFAPSALTLLAAVADDRVPIPVRFLLIVGRDLEGKGLTMLERRAAIEADTGDAQNGEAHGQHIALLAARIVAGSLVNSGDFTVRKRRGVEPRGVQRVVIEPETNRILRRHVRPPGAYLISLDHTTISTVYGSRKR